MYKRILGNEYDWKSKRHHFLKQLRAMYTPGHGLTTAISDYVDERKADLLAKGDVEAIAKIDAYYTSHDPKAFIIENPIKVNDKHLFCYISRKNGLIVPDAELTEKRYSLREYLVANGIPHHRPTSQEELSDIHYNSPENVYSLIDFELLGRDVILYVTSYSTANDPQKLADEIGFPIADNVVTSYYYPGDDDPLPDAELWGACHGFLAVQCPIMKTDVVIPYTDHYSLGDILYGEPGEGEKWHGYDLMAKTYVPVKPLDFKAMPLNVKADARLYEIRKEWQPLSQEERDKISVKLTPSKHVTGTVEMEWINDTQFQLKYDLTFERTDFSMPWRPQVMFEVTYPEGSIENRTLASFLWYNKDLKDDITILYVSQDSVDPTKHTYRVDLPTSGGLRRSWRGNTAALDLDTGESYETIGGMDFFYIDGVPVGTRNVKLIFQPYDQPFNELHWDVVFPDPPAGDPTTTEEG